jgi:hypothetical protein
MRSRTAVQPPSWTERPPRKPAGEKANAARQSNLLPAQSIRNRCTEAIGLCRSCLTVDAKVKCSSTVQLCFPDAPRDPLTPHQSFPRLRPSRLALNHHLAAHLPTTILVSTSISTPYQPDPAHLTFRSPIALHSYHPNPTHESTAPGRGLMPGGAGQLSRGGGGQGRGAGAIAAEPSWVAERPRRRDPGEVGPPRGARRARGVRTPARPVVALSASSGPPCDVRPTGRADIQRPRVRCPRVRCPGVRCPGVRGIQVSGRTGSGVRGAAAALSAPWTPEWLGVADRPGRAQRVDVPPWPVGGVVACLHRAGREGDAAALAVAGSHEIDRSQGRRLASVPAAEPSWPQRADAGPGPGPGCRARWRGSTRPSRCSPVPAGRPGRSPAWC